MTAPHSPAPWRIDEAGIDGLVPFLDANGERVATVEGGNAETDMANARLIVAAPDLFAACEQADALLTVTDETEARRDPAHPLNAIRRALAKARGA